MPESLATESPYLEDVLHDFELDACAEAEQQMQEHERFTREVRLFPERFGLVRHHAATPRARERRGGACNGRRRGSRRSTSSRAGPGDDESDLDGESDGSPRRGPLHAARIGGTR